MTGKNSKIIVNKQEENSEKGLKRQLFFCLEMQSEKEKMLDGRDTDAGDKNNTGEEMSLLFP